jgi:outer membrane immunogenic protein
MIRTCLVAGAMVAAWTASAAAADLRPVHKAPPPALVQSWTGFYLGANVGWAWANDDVTWTGNPAGFGGGFTPILNAAGTGAIDSDGVTAGVQAGFNYQISSIVLGVEADLNYTDLSGSRTVVLPPPAALGTFATSTFESNWLATFRGRIGVLVAPSLLAYVTGGLAIADVSTSDLGFFTAPLSTNAAAIDEVRAGWTIGGGLEWAFASNWSAKLEYLYVDLGTVSTTSANTVIPIATILHEHDIKEHLVRVGVNYRFGRY